MTAGCGLRPRPHRVVGRRRLAGDVVSLELEPLDGEPLAFRAGQFNMLTAFGVGEVAISISGAPGEGSTLHHTVRDVGAVSHALTASRVGSLVGVRGAFGTDWGVDALEAEDVVAVAGGIGLAPLRGAIEQLVSSRTRRRRREGAPEAPHPGEHHPPREAREHHSTQPRPPHLHLSVLVGARRPDQLIFEDDLERWREAGAEVEVTVDLATPGWEGGVGVVTALVPRITACEPDRSVAFVCGPELMMRFSARALLDWGMDPERIFVSLERNMQCGCGICGHCQLGPLLLCRDGPVVRYDRTVASLLQERER